MIRYGAVVLFFVLEFSDVKAMESAVEEIPIMRNDQKIGRVELIPLIDDQAYVVNDRSFVASFSCICKVNENHWLMIDTPCTPLVAEAVMSWVSNKFGSNQQFTAINTHHHVDCVGGNKALLDKGFHVYATSLTHHCFMENNQSTVNIKKLFSKYSEELANELDYTMPDSLIKDIENPGDEVTMTVGQIDIKIMYPGHAHAQDNIVVYIPQYKVLFGGCMIICPPRNLGYLGEANLDLWKKAIDLVSDFVKDKDIEFVIPGHPASNVDQLNDLDLFTKANIEHTQELTVSLDERKRYIKEGLTNKYSGNHA